MIVGLTGGVAAGKSTVRQGFATSCGIDVFDADQCVHNILESDSGVAGEIRRIFGPKFLRPDGRPDRTALRELVFKNDKARHSLEALIHPLVREEWLAHRQRCLAEGRHYLADIPLLYETGAEPFFDAVVVVACSPATQMARLKGRGICPDTAQAMLASQLPLRQKINRASFVIWNDGSLAALGRQIELIVNQLFKV